MTPLNVIIAMFLLFSFTVDSRRNNGHWYRFLKQECDKICHKK